MSPPKDRNFGSRSFFKKNLNKLFVKDIDKLTTAKKRMQMGPRKEDDCRMDEVEQVIKKCKTSSSGFYSKLTILENFEDLVYMDLTEKDELWLGFRNEIVIYSGEEKVDTINVKGELKFIRAYKDKVFVVSKELDKDQLVIYDRKRNQLQVIPED